MTDRPTTDTTWLVERIVGADTVVNEVELRYVKVAEELRTAVTARADFLEQFGRTGKPLEDALLEANLRLPKKTVEAWERIIKGRLA